MNSGKTCLNIWESLIVSIQFKGLSSFVERRIRSKSIQAYKQANALLYISFLNFLIILIYFHR